MAERSEVPVVTDVLLAPGEFYFGRGSTRLHTLLGSCVAITLWHPVKRVGGMCHYLLPTRGGNRHLSPGHYGDDAIQLFAREISRRGTLPHEYDVKVFGGGNMFESGPVNTVNVSVSNIEYGLTLLNEYGFRISASDVGGNCHRKIRLDLWSGDVWIQRGSSARACA